MANLDHVAHHIAQDSVLSEEYIRAQLELSERFSILSEEWMAGKQEIDQQYPEDAARVCGPYGPVQLEE